MAISFVASAESTDTASGVNCTLPATVVAGHRLLAIVASNATAGYSHIPPAGWDLVVSSAGMSGGGTQFASIYSRTAQTGDASSLVSFGVTPTGSKDVAVIAVYSGSITTPVVMAAAALPEDELGVSDVDMPSVDVDALPTTLVAAVSKKGGTDDLVFTPPAGFTLRQADSQTGGGAIGVAFADAAAGATGPTAVGPWGTDVASDHGTGFLLSLAEGDPPALTAPSFHRFTVSGWYPPLA